MNYDISTAKGMENAIDWTRRHLSMIREGGAWMVPRTRSVYIVSHEKRTLTRTGLMPDPSINKVAARMGWTVIERNTP